MTNQEEYEDYFRLTEPCESVVFDFDKAGGEYADNNKCITLDHADPYSSETNLLLSKHYDGSGLHRVVLDLDMDAALIPSTTPGHHHLILDRDMDWHSYTKLLKALADAGIIENGYYRAAVQNGYTAIRTPWTKKVTKAVGGLVESFNKATKALTSISSSFQTIKFAANPLIPTGTMLAMPEGWGAVGTSVKLTAPVTAGSTITIEGVGTFDSNGNPIESNHSPAKPGDETVLEEMTRINGGPNPHRLQDPFASLTVEPETTDEQSEKLQAMIKKVV